MRNFTFSLKEVRKWLKFITSLKTELAGWFFIVNLEKHCSKMFVGLTDREADGSGSDLENSI